MKDSWGLGCPFFVRQTAILSLTVPHSSDDCKMPQRINSRFHEHQKFPNE